MNEPEVSYHILRFCAHSCLVLYLFRSTPPHITSPLAKSFDEGMRRVFEQVHRKMSDTAWLQATLPVRQGGLGLTLCTSINVIANAISNLTNMPLIERFLHATSTRVAILLAPSFDTLTANLDLRAELHLEALLSHSHPLDHNGARCLQ